MLRMQISGLQKLTLIDYPGKTACTIFLSGCNFKCGFCHNPELVLSNGEKENYSENNILDFLDKRKKYLDGVCVTGGEPLINPELKDFLKRIKEKGFLVKVDTNGSYPDHLKELIQNDVVDYIAMDIKSDKDNYDILAGIDVDIKKIEESIKTIVNSGIDYELRTTVIRGYHDPEKIKKIGKWINKLAGKPKKYYIQNFIPREGKLVDEKFEKISPFENEEIEEMKKAAIPYFEKVELRA
ncbi:MAG: anaerobic ribonucleoside-triphosphate reductase activating protein [Candidatus Nanoarchaeia archaeon]|nr:anaerobic ribonucleoside-triphosphate reductase activating protein [Candidatus Nanoarchaeia archaeon]